MLSVRTSSVVDRGFKPWIDLTKQNNIYKNVYTPGPAFGGVELNWEQLKPALCMCGCAYLNSQE